MLLLAGKKLKMILIRFCLTNLILLLGTTDLNCTYFRVVPSYSLAQSDTSRGPSSFRSVHVNESTQKIRSLEYRFCVPDFSHSTQYQSAATYESQVESRIHCTAQTDGR